MLSVSVPVISSVIPASRSVLDSIIYCIMIMWKIATAFKVTPHSYIHGRLTTFLLTSDLY